MLISIQHLEPERKQQIICRKILFAGLTAAHKTLKPPWFSAEPPSITEYLKYFRDIALSKGLLAENHKLQLQDVDFVCFLFNLHLKGQLYQNVTHSLMFSL